MFKAIKETVETIKKTFSKESREELYRDEFETEALASGEFKGIRFTRLDDGKYADANLEAAWRTWVREAMLIDDVV